MIVVYNYFTYRSIVISSIFYLLILFLLLILQSRWILVYLKLLRNQICTKVIVVNNCIASKTYLSNINNNIIK